MLKDAFIKLHLSIILAGLTGLFGKLVSMHQLPMVLYRVGLAAVVIFIIMAARRQLKIIPGRSLARVAWVGALLVLHWIFFFGSIKASNISVGVVCYSLVGFFTSIVEPLILRTRFSARDILLSLVTVAGIILIFHFDVQYRYGIMLGIVSSLLASLFTIYNKLVVDTTGLTPSTMLLYEMISGTVVMAVIVPVMFGAATLTVLTPSVSDFLWLLILSSLCTVGLQLLQIDALKVLSAFTVNLSYNLEPIYSIIIAMTLFHEAHELSWSFYAGLTLIIMSVLAKTTLIATHHR